jgi:hypothetical protein
MPTKPRQKASQENMEALMYVILEVTEACLEKTEANQEKAETKMEVCLERLQWKLSEL